MERTVRYSDRIKKVESVKFIAKKEYFKFFNCIFYCRVCEYEIRNRIIEKTSA